jgi:hypothetical protein
MKNVSEMVSCGMKSGKGVLAVLGLCLRNLSGSIMLVFLMDRIYELRR